jgi:hypothetical protein
MSIQHSARPTDPFPRHDKKRRTVEQLRAILAELRFQTREIGSLCEAIELDEVPPTFADPVLMTFREGWHG